MLEYQNEQPQRGEMCIIEEIGMMTVILLVQTIIQVYKKLSKLQFIKVDMFIYHPNICEIITNI